MAQKKRINRSSELKVSGVLEELTGKLSASRSARKYKIKDPDILGCHAPAMMACMGLAVLLTGPCTLSRI
jgi:hypothetical protein